jgi:hypothetical protein
MRMLLAIAGFTIWVRCTAPLNAQTAPDLTGFWERHDDVGAGSFSGLDEKIPRAALIDPQSMPSPGGGAQLPPEEGKPHKVGEPYIVTTGRCGGGGMPFMMGHSAALDILQSKDEVLIIPEFPSTRHVYMDGRSHPAAGALEPSNTGHSIGHWEGGTLVIDTIGMMAGGGIPGGGRKTPETRLLERYKLLDGGQRLSVTFVWDDPKIYRRPQTYEYIYYKDPPSTYALEEWCDSSDPLQRQSIVPPPQK